MYRIYQVSVLFIGLMTVHLFRSDQVTLRKNNLKTTLKIKESTCFRYPTLRNGSQTTVDNERSDLVTDSVVTIPESIEITTDYGYPDEDLLAHYAFEGNVDDTSGNGRHGRVIIVNNGTNLTYCSGLVGNAAIFSGQVIQIDDFNNFDFGPNFTLCFWLQCSGTGTYRQHILNNGLRAGGEFEISLFGRKIKSSLFNLNSEHRMILVDESGFLEWNHVAMTYNGSNMVLYLNAEQKDSSDCCNGPIPRTNLPVFIGGGFNYGHLFFGLMDEIKLFKKALTRDDINKEINRRK